MTQFSPYRHNGRSLSFVPSLLHSGPEPVRREPMTVFPDSHLGKASVLTRHGTLWRLPSQVDVLGHRPKWRVEWVPAAKWARCGMKNSIVSADDLEHLINRLHRMVTRKLCDFGVGSIAQIDAPDPMFLTHPKEK